MTEPLEPSAPLARTPLYDVHVARGAKMVPFAGYSMPVHYAAGIIAEHAQTRQYAGLFDVSHMGQVLLAGPEAGKRLERLVPGDIQGLAEGRIRYTQFLDGDGNILDDLMVARLPGAVERFHLVVNAACRAADFAHLQEHLPDLDLVLRDDVALLALQGPASAGVLERHLPDVAGMPFMSIRDVEAGGVAFRVARSGYTGEDGFEISVPAASAVALTERLLAEPEVLPIGLGARDTLRLEAGLCLYGHDIDTTTTPIEAGLAWSIGKRRRLEGGFFGEERVRLQLAHRPTRRRVGLRLEGRVPAREGADIATPDGISIGKVTSGSFGPTVEGPIAMGYVGAEFAARGTPVHLMVRGKPLTARVAELPFVPHRYFRGP